MYQRGKMVQRREAKGYSAPDEDAVSLEISDRKTAQDAPAPLQMVDTKVMLGGAALLKVTANNAGDGGHCYTFLHMETGKPLKGEYPHGALLRKDLIAAPLVAAAAALGQPHAAPPPVTPLEGFQLMLGQIANGTVDSLVAPDAMNARQQSSSGGRRRGRQLRRSLAANQPVGQQGEEAEEEEEARASS